MSDISTMPILIKEPEVSKQEFAEFLADCLRRDNFDMGVLPLIDPDKFELKYLEMVRFAGNVSCRYEARMAASLEITVDDEKKTIKPGTLLRGDTPNVPFDFAIYTGAPDAPVWTRSVEPFALNDLNLMPLTDGRLSTDAVAMCAAGDAAAFWSQNGQNIMDEKCVELVEATAGTTASIYYQLGYISSAVAEDMERSGISSEVPLTDVRVQSSSRLMEIGPKVLVPFWVQEFEYEGTKYYVCGSAGVPGQMTVFLPKPKENRLDPAEQARQELPVEHRNLKLVKWGAVLIVVAWFVAGFIAAIIVALLWFAAKLYFTAPINKRVKELEQTIANENQAKAAAVDRQILRR